MRILLDENLDPELADLLKGFEVTTVAQAGWRSYENGALLALVRQHFDVFLTMDKDIAHQHTTWAIA